MRQHKNLRNPRFSQPITESWRLTTVPLIIILVSIMFTSQATTDRFEDFSVDPNWEGKGNRTAEKHARTVVQNFGYSPTNYAGGETPGEIGGRISRSLTPATYATVIPTKTLDDYFTASGKFAVTQADGSSGMLIGWFNADSRGGRTPNSLGFRLDGNGGKYWVFFEYGTQNYLTGSGATLIFILMTFPIPSNQRFYTGNVRTGLKNGFAIPILSHSTDEVRKSRFIQRI